MAVKTAAIKRPSRRPSRRAVVTGRVSVAYAHYYLPADQATCMLTLGTQVKHRALGA